MRLVIKRGAGLIGLYRRNPRHQTTNLKTKQKLRQPRYVIANADDLNKKYVGKGSDVSTNCMRNDAVDSNNNESTELKSDQESVMETISNSSKESTVDRNEEMIADDKELKDKSDEEIQAAGVKCKYSPSYIDFLINNNIDDSVIPTPTKQQCFDSSMSNTHEKNDDSIEKNDDSIKSGIDDFDTQQSKHSIIKIPTTKRKRYPQKSCVYCRQNHGVRNDTRYICTFCDVALCKKPCFAEYHLEKYIS